MITVTLTSSLAALLPEIERPCGHSATCSITVDADNWADTVSELRTRYGRLGRHVFDASGHLRPGFLVACNDEVSRRPNGPKDVSSGDEMFIFVQLAGG